MKKFLVVLLALAMVFAVATTAMAADKQIPDYSDTTTSTAYASDIYRLTALGVLQGNTGWGGAYRPNDNLTRAEFAKIACYMFGKQSYISYYAAQKSAFSDVPEGDWAEGWINCAYDNGLMVGVGNGKFNPNANVSKQEVATVTLRAVGYTDALPGAWPADYIAKSQKVYSWFEDGYKDGLSLFDYVEKIDGSAATRAEMAAIVNYCLDLFRVEYVGNQTVIAGVSNLLGVDSDGFAYIKANTNELATNEYLEELFATIRDYKTDLLWDVFDAYVIPEWQFMKWNASTTGIFRFVEASGWGYEDFEKDELLFEKEPDGQLSVATDYYVFDKYLDGQLWQLGGRYAFLTVVENDDAVNQGEVVFAEVLSDVTYVGDEAEIKVNGVKAKYDNADIFSITFDSDKNYDVYDYDWFEHATAANVKKVADDKALMDELNFGEDIDGEWGFCKLEDCDTHDQLYVFLKDGKLQDASCLKLNDVVYYAGRLSTGDNVDLYIVYTPKAATFDQLVNGVPNPKMNVSGKDYFFCDNIAAHFVSFDGGYEDGSFEKMTYDKLYDYLGDDCLFAAGYGKRYVASIIFAADENARKYGVLSKLTEKMIAPDKDNWYATGGTVVGPDGKDDAFTLAEEVNLGSDDTYWGDAFIGWLANYYPDEDGELDWNDGLDAVGGIYKTDSDVGFVPFEPKAEKVVTVTAKGAFKDAAAVNTALSTTSFPLDGLKLTADTIVFEVITKKVDDPLNPGTKIDVFKEVKIAAGSKYIGKEFTVKQLDVFEKDGKNIKVLYVVDPKVNGGTIMGLFDVSRADKDGGFAQYLKDNTKVYFTDNQGKDDLADAALVYAAYKTQENEVKTLYVYDNETLADPTNLSGGDFVVLYDAYGKMNADANVNVPAVIVENVADADSHIYGLYFDDFEDADFTSGCEFIDLTEDGNFDKGYFTGTYHGASDYFFAATYNEDGEILQVFRFFDD